MIEITDGIGRSISPPLKHDEVNNWLNEHNKKQAELQKNTMKERLIFVVAWIMFLPLCFSLIIIAIPLYIIKGVNIFEYLERYVDYLAGNNQ